MEENNFKNTTTRKLAKILAKEELESLPESIITEIESKEKRNFLIATILISISALVMLICCIISFSSSENGFGFFVLIMFIPSLIATLWFVRTFLNRSRTEWVISNLETKYIRNPNLIYHKTNELNTNNSIFDSDNQNEKYIKREQLQELKEMLDSGLITQEDYEQKKKQILGL